MLSTDTRVDRLDFMKDSFKEKQQINYLYFGFFFLFLSLLIIFSPTLPSFFIFYGIIQAFLEVSLLVLIAYFLQKKAPRPLFFLFISIFFALLLLHFTNFTIIRVMDTSVSYIFKFFFGSGLGHLIAGFQALNMNWTMIAITATTMLFLPIVGLSSLLAYRKLARKKQLFLSPLQISACIGLSATFLFILDMASYPFFNNYTHDKYKKTLPLGMTFLSPAPHPIPLPGVLAAARSEEETLKNIPKGTLVHKPNIYFFVIETLRKDFLTAAPHLTAFGHENIEFEHSFSNACSTQLSWFAIFHADCPLYWATMRDTWTHGSAPLQYLKKLGYQIHVYSSADLRFFNMDKLLFGEQRLLANTIEEYSFDRTIEPCDRDALAMKGMEKNLKRSGQAYLIFLDSTHSEYSFPKDFPLLYEPISKEIDYLTISAKSPELELIKNRYRNSIHYVDHLMGNFFTLLKKNNLYDDAIIAITGDHGEDSLKRELSSTALTSITIRQAFPS